MAINTKAVKARIKTVKNTKKITKAMEMIAAVKMRKAVEQAKNTREYAVLADELMQNLGSTKLVHPLTEKRKVKKALMIVITSNRGLCGSYNAKVLKEAYKVLKKQKNITFEMLAIGKKAGIFAKQQKLQLISLYDSIHEKPKFEDIFPISNEVIATFTQKKYDEVIIVYTNYISGLVQKVESRSILPFSRRNVEEMILQAGNDMQEKISTSQDSDGSVEDSESSEYEFEPTKEELLNYVLPTLIEIQIYQALLESAASEHSSRMIAMKNASESAGEMIDELTLEFNKGRQAAITQEVAEINAGANALGI